MKVLQVFKDYFPPVRGGIEQHVNDLVHSLEGYQFEILTSSRSRRRVVDDDNGVRVIRASELARPVSTAVTPSWSKFLRQSGADLMHFHMPNPFGELMFLSSRAKSPMIATYHADIVGRKALLPFFAPFQQRFLRRARSIIVSSPRLRDSAPSLVDHRDKCVVIPFGVEPGEWTERPEASDALRDRYPGPLLVFLGRIAYYKGLDVLIQAMRSVEATCLVVGGGPLRDEMQGRVAEFGLGRKVIFIGEIPDEERAVFYHAADAFVLPSTSRAEAFGISMLEAMACGTPAISTDLGTGTSWLNKNLETGIVVEPNNPGTLARAIEALLGDDARREAMGHAAAERVRTSFTRFQMLESISSLYASI